MILIVFYFLNLSYHELYNQRISLSLSVYADAFTHTHTHTSARLLS